MDYLVMEDIHKSFSKVSVLNGVNFSARKGEVHGFVGGNGAGKSTIMNILGGIYTKDSGRIYINGELVEIKSPSDAVKNGISFIHQELKLFSMRTVADNIYMSRLPVKRVLPMVDDAEKNRMAQRWLDELELKVSPKDIVGDLSIAERQMIEIAKACSYEAKIMIFDEPTSSLTSKETEVLFRVIRKLKEKGVCIIFISHKLNELFALCDRSTVLRNGTAIGTVTMSETTADELVGMMIGTKLAQYYPVVHEHADSQTVLKVENLVNDKLDGVNFELQKGEILGLFGLVGAGRSETARAIFGIDSLDKGTIAINGTPKKIKSARKAMSESISFLTENRRDEGLVLPMGLGTNMTLPILNRLSIPVIGWVRRKKEHQKIQSSISEFHIKCKNPNQKVKFLSGGNQQKVVLSKWLMTGSDILILDEPTRGIDVGAKAEIYETIVRMSKEGKSIIVISSEAPELLGVCHRILVMHEGKVVASYKRSEVEEHELVKSAMGGE